LLGSVLIFYDVKPVEATSMSIPANPQQILVMSKQPSNNFIRPSNRTINYQNKDKITFIKDRNLTLFYLLLSWAIIVL